MLITRDKTRTEEDDWKLNVQPKLDETRESVPLYAPLPEGCTGPLVLVGWRIQNKFE